MSNSKLESKIINTLSGFEELKIPWNNLLARVKNATPFQTHDWLISWWKHFGLHKDLFIILVIDGDDIKAIAPFMIIKKMNVKIMKFIGSGRSDYLNFLMIDAAPVELLLKSIFNCLKTNATNWDLIEFRDIILSNDFEFLLSSEINRQNYKFVRKEDTICPFLSIDGSWEDYMSSKTSQQRYKIKRVERDISKQAGVRVFTNYDFLNLNEMLQLIKNVESKSWKVKKGNPRFSGAVPMQFFEEIFERFRANNWIDVRILSLNKQAIAYNINFLFNNKYYNYNLAFDKDYGNIRPGMYLTNLTLKGAFEQKVTEYDFLRGEEKYKFFWASNYRQLYQIIIFKKTLKSTFLFIFLFKLRWFFKRFEFFKKIHALKTNLLYRLKPGNKV